MEQLDQGVVTLLKALRQVESNGNYNATSKDGSFGAYQFTKPTWDATARKFGVNAPWQGATKQQQNEVAYKQVKEWKDKGFNIGEIASMWNAGSGRPEDYKESVSGTNSSGIKYNVASYAQKVANYYKIFKAGGETQQPTASNNGPVTATQGNPNVGINGDLFKAGKSNPQGANPNAVAGALNAVTGSEQNFGKSLAQSLYLMSTGKEGIDKQVQQHIDNASKLTDLIRANRHPEMNATWQKIAEGEIADAQKVGGNILGNARTPKQIVGDALGTATDIAAAGSYGNVAESATKGVGILPGAARGAATGAIAGGTFGLAKGVSSGLSANKSASGVVGSGATGLIGGAAFGGIAGGILGGISGGIKANQQGLNIMSGKNDVLNMVSDPLDKRAKVGAIKMAGRPGGATTQGAGEIVVKPNQRTIDVADAATPFVKGKNPIQAAASLNSEVSRITNSEVLPYLQQNDRVITSAELREINNQLDAIKPSVFTRSDATANNVFNAIKDNIKSEVSDANTLSSLYQKRISIDQMVQSETGGKAFDENKFNAAYESYRQARQVINKYITQNLPAGQQNFANKLALENKLLDARDNIALNFYKQVGTNWFQRIAKSPAAKVGIGAAGVLGLEGLATKAASLVKGK